MREELPSIPKIRTDKASKTVRYKVVPGAPPSTALKYSLSLKFSLVEFLTFNNVRSGKIFSAPLADFPPPMIKPKKTSICQSTDTL